MSQNGILDLNMNLWAAYTTAAGLGPSDKLRVTDDYGFRITDDYNLRETD